jgi:glycosyltransferase involved in cell wall biosynthesis
MSKTRVALITHDFATGGGTATMTRFLYTILKRSDGFDPEIVSLATSSRDRASVLSSKPGSWTTGPRVLEQDAGGIPYRHAGAVFPEFETQRYKPRRMLRDLLAGFEILQFVAGIPAWGCTAGERLAESLIWFATMARNDRASRIEASRGLRRINYLVMTSAAEACERRALREAGASIALSDYSAKQAKELAPAHRLKTIPCGVDTSLFRPEPAAPRDYILCVGRLSDPRKNIRLLLKAWGQAAARDPSVPDLYLVGETPDAAGSEAIQNCGAADRVRILGLRRGEELAALYRRAAMLAVSSDEEGLGIVILEAMASGIPVVSTRCGGPESAVVDGVTGFLTPVGDADALRDAILRLTRDSGLRRELGENSLLRAREVFSLDAVGNQFLDLYQRRPGRS